jgi:hypothetical protein
MSHDKQLANLQSLIYLLNPSSKKIRLQSPNLVHQATLFWKIFFSNRPLSLMSAFYLIKDCDSFLIHKRFN